MARILLLSLALAGGIRAEAFPAVPPQPDLTLRQAYDAEIRDDREGALRLYEQYLSQSRESAFIRGQQARLLASLQKKEDSLAMAKRAYEIAPNRKEYTVLYAELLRQYGKNEEAYGILRNAVLNFPDDSELEFFLAESCNETGRTAEAIVHYHQTLYYPDSGSTRYPIFRSISLLRLAVAKLRKQEREAARRYLTRYLELNPDRLYPRYLLATDVLFESGDYEAALRESETVFRAGHEKVAEAGIEEDRLRAAIALLHFYFDLPEAEMHLAAMAKQKQGLFSALLAAQQRKDEEAVRLLLPILRDNPSSLFARLAYFRIKERRGEDLSIERMFLASILFQGGRVRDGISLLEKSAEEAKAGKSRVPLWRIERQIGQGYFRLKQPYRAMLAYRSAMADAQDESAHAEMHLELARILSGDPPGRGEQALAILTQLVDKGDARALPQRAFLRQSLGYCEEAIQDWGEVEKARKVQQIEGSFLRGGCYEALGKYAEAESIFRKLSETHGNLTVVQNSLSYILALQNKNLPEALALIEKAVAAEPDDAHLQDTLGWVYFKQGDHVRARYHLQLASRLMEEVGDKNAEVYDHLGQVYEALGKKDRAMYYYDSAVRVLSGKERLMPYETRMLSALKQKMEKPN